MILNIIYATHVSISSSDFTLLILQLKKLQNVSLPLIEKIQLIRYFDI